MRRDRWPSSLTVLLRTTCQRCAAIQCCADCKGQVLRWLLSAAKLVWRQNSQLISNDKHVGLQGFSVMLMPSVHCTLLLPVQSVLVCFLAQTPFVDGPLASIVRP